MSATSRKSMSGTIGETLYNTIVLDSFGAQIIDVLFYDSEGGEVTPTGGFYSLQYSPNSKVWLDFEGAQFPARAAEPVEDWQAGGVVEKIRAVPFNITGAATWKVMFRTHGIGMPMFPANNLTANRYFSAVSTVQVSGFDHSVLQGNAVSVSHRFIIRKNSSVSIKVRKNADSVITFASANGAFVSYSDGNVSGNLIGLASGARLNTLEELLFQSSFEFYDGPAIGGLSITNKDRIDAFFVSNGGGVIQLENTTNENIETFFSCGVVSLSIPVVPYMLTANTSLVETTQMETYNVAD
jgi:hypothetical protein